MAFFGYGFPEEKEFKVVEKIALLGLKEDCFEVSDHEGKAVFKVENNLLTVTGKLTMYDACTGAAVLTVRKKILALLGEAWVIEDPHGVDVATVKDPLLNIMPALKVKLNNGEKLDVSGGFLKKKFTITRGDTEIGTVKKESQFKGVGAFIRSHFTDKQAYYVHVSPNEDAALLVAVAIIVDECFHEAKEEEKPDDVA